MSRTWHKKKESNKRGAKAVSSHCANHGTCGWCQGNRHHKFERQAKQFDEDEYNASAHQNNDFDLIMEHHSDDYWCEQYDIGNDNFYWNEETKKKYGKEE